MSDELTEVWRVQYYDRVAGKRLRCASYFPSLHAALVGNQGRPELGVLSIDRIELDGRLYEDTDDF